MNRILRTNVVRLPLMTGEVGSAVLIITVLVAGQIGDYAAYRGAVPGGRYFETVQDEWVAANGNKLSFHEAQALWPGIERDKYRD